MPQIPSPPAPLVFVAASESETDRLAAAVAEMLIGGDVLKLSGSLGTGKTRFVQGLAAALGCHDALVNSPTFVLVQEYDGRLPVYHLDAYRLRDGEEFSDLGGEELLEAGGVTCIEWAERVADRLPREGLTIRIEAVGPHERRFELTPEDDSWVSRLAEVESRLRGELRDRPPAGRGGLPRGRSSEPREQQEESADTLAQTRGDRA